MHTAAAKPAHVHELHERQSTKDARVAYIRSHTGDLVQA